VTTLVSTTFTGTNGSAWPAPWTTVSGTNTIQSNRGQQVTPSSGTFQAAEARANLTLPTGRIDATVRFSTLLNVSMRINVRYNPATGNGYRIVVPTDYAGFQLLRVDAFTETPLCEDFTLTWAANTDYQVAVTFTGGLIRAKRWITGNAEPAIWQLNTVDTTYTTGDIDLVTVSGGTAAAVTGLWDNVVIQDVANGLDKTRVGYHNDAFLAPSAEFGTFTTFSLLSEAATRAYVQEDALVPMGHESAVSNSPTSDWANAAVELGQYHFSFLNPAYHPTVISSWGTNINIAAQNLGYRLRLTTATFPFFVSPGGSYAVSLTLTNDGYAAPHRQRPCNLVFVSGGTTYTQSLGLDIRTLTPGSVVTVSTTVIAPSVVGTWALYLAFPDPSVSLIANPSYAIQLANVGTWDATNGRNDLTQNLTVAPGGNVATLVTQNITTTGILPTYQAAAVGGDAMIADATSFLHVKNGAGSSMTVSLAEPLVIDGSLTVTPRVVTVNATSEQMIAVPDSLYRNPATGLAAITYSAVTTVTVAAIRR
jgi:hypothetical protein